MEFLLTTGLVSILFAATIVIISGQRADIYAFEDRSDLKYPCFEMSSMITDAAALGDGGSIQGRLEYNVTILGQTRQILVWEKLDDENRTYYCSYGPFEVTNGFNTSFTIEAYENITVTNVKGRLEVRDDALTRGLILHYRMDGYKNKTGSTIEDYGTTDLDGTITNALCQQAGYLDRSQSTSCYFDGTTDYVHVGRDKFEDENEGTIAAWINYDSGGGGTVFGSATVGNSAKLLRLMVNGLGEAKVSYQYYPSVSGSPNNWIIKGNDTMSAGEWYHVAVTSDGSTWRLYVNGNVQTTSMHFGGHTNVGHWFADLPSAVHQAYVGQIERDLGPLTFTGYIDEIRMYDRPLSDDEMYRLYTSYFNYKNITGDYFIR